MFSVCHFKIYIDVWFVSKDFMNFMAGTDVTEYTQTCKVSFLYHIYTIYLLTYQRILWLDGTINIIV